MFLVKVVLSQRDDSGYADIIGKRYQFPPKYLRAAEEAVGDGCIFYEPRRGENGVVSGRQAYWAAATIKEVFPDPIEPDRFVATVENFLPFLHPVPFRRADGSYWEQKLTREDGQVKKGSMGVSVRRIPDHEFALIWASGSLSSIGEEPSKQAVDAEWGLAEEQMTFERPVIEQLSNRRFRDRVFADQVRLAYDARCAVTGLKIINGGGRAEMEAAHIRPVASNGPDVVRNGVALSRTVHWMFDRGLLSIDDDFKLLKARPHLPDSVERLFDPSGFLQVPEAARDQPSRAFLRWHRENCFKG